MNNHNTNISGHTRPLWYPKGQIYFSVFQSQFSFFFIFHCLHHPICHLLLLPLNLRFQWDFAPRTLNDDSFLSLFFDRSKTQRTSKEKRLKLRENEDKHWWAEFLTKSELECLYSAMKNTRYSLEIRVERCIRTKSCRRHGNKVSFFPPKSQDTSPV